MRVSRRSFLAGLAGTTVLGSLGSGVQAWAGLLASGPTALRRDPRYPRRGFADFPTPAETGGYGAGTRGLPDPELLRQALREGVRLVDTSPDYRQGAVEECVGKALEDVADPVFVMTQLPVLDWESEHRTVAFHRSLRRSLGRLRRGDVEALLIRNAEPWQLEDPQFRDFAADARASDSVGHFGVSGHGPDMEPVLERVLDDDLFTIVLFGVHLAGFQRIPALLEEAAARGKILVAMKTREAALWNRLPGWEKEAERRRQSPWNGHWDLEFSRKALAEALGATFAHNALVSLRTEEDLALLK